MANDVCLMAVKTGNVVLNLPAEGGGRCNAVWLSDGCHLLAAAGSTRSICMWGLPEGVRLVVAGQTLHAGMIGHALSRLGCVLIGHVYPVCRIATNQHIFF